MSVDLQDLLNAKSLKNSVSSHKTEEDTPRKFNKLEQRIQGIQQGIYRAIKRSEQCY